MQHTRPELLHPVVADAVTHLTEVVELYRRDGDVRGWRDDVKGDE
jgi:hypothetical protein